MVRVGLLLVLVLTLFVATGCGNGDDKPITPVPTTVTRDVVSFTQSFVMPLSSVSTPATSLRGQTWWQEFALRINGTDYPPSTFTVDASANPPMVTLTFTLTLSKTTLGTVWNESTKTLSSIQLVEGGQVIATINATKANDQAANVTAIPVPVVAKYSVSADRVTVSLISGTGTPVSSIPTASDTLFLEKVTYLKNNVEYPLASGVADVPSVGTTFKLYFNTAVINTTNWTATVVNTDSNISFQLNSGTPADAALFTVTPIVVGGKSVITVVVNGDATRKLKANANYRVTLTSSTIARADKPLVAFPSNLTRTFRTAP
ncbi:MAG: hypothetical protein OZSIB_0174 [Candidatus Ozemobacter sibiricus]|jgi:hypothetical protein|uniref:Uncharacterized protein n=1 Tax=Candidatus Ozemobacter sibiricus TaxID=2268124 RepID=A0A367ZMF9_9BACT|nr:MAG: hypothetical protein OZSIB_0174 [Candidatus Ozemobacter sibiricus]